MKAIAAAMILALGSCATLPEGSYLRTGVGYSKGKPSGKAYIHIPLASR